MPKHSYEYLGSTSYNLIVWAFGFTFTINIIWTSGLFFTVAIFKQTNEEEYKEIRDADGN